MGKNFWIILTVIIVAVIGLIFLVSSDNDSTGGESTADILTVVETDHTKGAGTAGVTMIEYSDFECPACGAVYPMLKQIEAEFGDQVQIVFRHFPLVIHKNAMAAHRAAEAASKQDQFWQMHDMIFERQQMWNSSTNPTSIFEGYARELGLDMGQYVEDAASEEVFETISSSIKDGLEIGVNATPTFFLNGEKIPIPQDSEEARTVIQDAIDAAASEASQP